MASYLWEATGIAGPSGFGSASTAEQVTEGIDASHLTVIITGGSSGIGAEAARVMALRGAHVIIGARNVEAANTVKQSILESTPSARIDIIPIELSSLKSVRAFAEKFLEKDLPLNILINNAGIMYCPFQLSEDGIEMQFATNHLGHFLLTKLLLEKMKSTAARTGIEGRIVNLSSEAHMTTYGGGIWFDKINVKESYNDKLAYGQSKLANILHANELARRLKEEGANVTANSLHPGLIRTNLGRHSAFFVTALRIVTYVLWKSIPQGAATSCYVALHPDVKGVSGKYFADCNVSKTTANGTDEHLAIKLWDFSEELVKSG
ncbi:short-chain dehydrogenase TIC 32 B, chloroplastic-like [Curcuma longa]|uniref:short-chain dehydrogenase TIC 32 B, chloroplastic-like n=1 Tax=Curcuma longa TaxID=136217 RepID=UPI003D9F7C14